MTVAPSSGPGLVKRLVFSLVPLLAVLLLLAAVEVVLRLAGAFSGGDLVQEVRFDGVDWYQTNRGYLKKYFPANSPMVPEFKTALFRKQKTEQTFRVFCLGGSTMFGTPYDMNANIQGILRKQLRHRYPEREWEVVNWGASAINSNVVRDLLPELLRFEPDLVIIYMGHNEFYGPDGVGASYPEKMIPPLIRVKYALRELRLVRMLQSWFSGGPGPPGQASNLMRQVSEGSRVPLGSKDADFVVGLFDDNLRAILATLKRDRIPVVLSEVSSNLTFPPFMSDSLIDGRSAELFGREMKALAIHERYRDIIAATDQFLASETFHPVVTYWRGVALRGLGRSEESKKFLSLARDDDLLKFRAPAVMNSIIRAAGERHHVPVVPADSLLAASVPDGIPDDTLFWEHLHPTPEGYYIIASGFAAAVDAINLLPEPGDSRPLLPMNVDTLSLCWLDLAYGDRAIQHLTGKWPFEEYARTPRVLGQAPPELATIVQETYKRTLQWNEACYATATVFWRMGRLRDALTTYEAMLEEYPFSYYTNYLAGNLLNAMGNSRGALLRVKRSVRSNPAYAPARLDLGLLEVNSGEHAAGIADLREVLRLTGQGGSDARIRANAHYGIAAAHANAGNWEDARGEIIEALELLPGYPDALRLRQEIERVRSKSTP